MPMPPFHYSRSCSASSAGSAYSQCADAVVSGPPKKGRRRVSSSNYFPDSAYPPLRPATKNQEPDSVGKNAPETYVPPPERCGTELEIKNADLEALLQQQYQLLSLLRRENELLRRALAKKGHFVENIITQDECIRIGASPGTIPDVGVVTDLDAWRIRNRLLGQLEISISNVETKASFLVKDLMPHRGLNGSTNLPFWAKMLQQFESESGPMDSGKGEGPPSGLGLPFSNRYATRWDNEELNTLNMARLAPGPPLKSDIRRWAKLHGSSSNSSASKACRARTKRKRSTSLKRNKMGRLSVEAVTILSEWLLHNGLEKEPSEFAIRMLATQTGLSRKRVALWLQLQSARPAQDFSIQAWLLSSSDDEPASDAEIENTLQSMQANDQAAQNEAFAPVSVGDAHPDAAGGSMPDILGPGDARALPEGSCLGRPQVPVMTALEDQAVDDSWANELWPLDWPLDWPEPATPSFPAMLEQEFFANATASMDLEVATKNGAAIPPGLDAPGREAPDCAIAIDAQGPVIPDPPLIIRTQTSGDTGGTNTDIDHIPTPKRGSNIVLPMANFQCTFCHVALTEGAWKRHEESKHLPRTSWTCMGATGPICLKSVSGPVPSYHCNFCPLVFPSKAGAYRHAQTDHPKIRECLSRPEEERTFVRRDNLQQHATQYHGCKEPLRPEVVAAWENPVRGEQVWTCGFCGELLHSWRARATHLRVHFRQGATMEDWKNEWDAPGLDAAAERQFLTL